MRYKRTKIVLPKKGQPLNMADILIKQVNKEDIEQLPITTIPVYKKEKNKFDLFLFFKHSVLAFRP